MLCNTAIFYDIENLMGLFGAKTNTVLHLDEIYRRVLEMEGVHGVSVQRAYADWALPQHKNLRNSVLQVGIEPVHVFNTNQHDKVKNASDVSLIIDVVESIAKRPEIENYVIASGDGIFAFLAKKLHENGKRVIGCSFDRITNNIFRNACDYFIALEKEDSSIIATSSRRKSKSTAGVAAAAEIPAQTQPAAAGNFPKTKYTDALAAAGLEIWRDAGDSSGCFHMVRQMVEAIFNDSTRDMPGLEISVFTNYISHFLPNFKVTRHGFKRVSEFIRFILSGSDFCMYSVEDNVLLMGPRAAAKGSVVDDVNGLIVTTASGSKYNSVFHVPAGEPFIYTILPQEKPPAAPKRARKKPAPKPAASPAPQEKPEIAGSIRKWIKEQFERLSEGDKLSPGEIRKLASAEYSLNTFGVRTPVLRLIESRSNLTEQRTANGKVKYWKESFRFNNKTYLVYKEWVSGLHEERFIAWLAALKK